MTMIRLEMKNYNIILTQAAKISTSSSGKIGKYILPIYSILAKYLAGEQILLSNQKQIIEQAKFTYSRPGKAFEK